MLVLWNIHLRYKLPWYGQLSFLIKKSDHDGKLNFNDIHLWNIKHNLHTWCTNNCVIHFWPNFVNFLPENDCPPPSQLVCLCRLHLHAKRQSGRVAFLVPQHGCSGRLTWVADGTDTFPQLFFHRFAVKVKWNCCVLTSFYRLFSDQESFR